MAERIFVDFATWSTGDGHYIAVLADFATEPPAGYRFTGYDDGDPATEVECRVVASDPGSGWVLHRPVDPTDAPPPPDEPAPDVTFPSELPAVLIE